MIFKSIKWRLQAWHALMLLTVLAGFGFTAHRLDQISRFQRIDHELHSRAKTVQDALARTAPPGRLETDRPPPDEMGPPPFEPRDGPEGEMGPGPERGGERLLGRGPTLSAREKGLFEGEGRNAYYFVLWRRDGPILAKSDSAPADVPSPKRGDAETRMRGKYRECIMFTPPGEAVVAGCDITSDVVEMRRLSWLLLAAGGGVLALGLVGGWWLATRAISPIKHISEAAGRISAGDLSQRIPAADAENELGELAVVLNSTFSRLEAAFVQQRQFTSDAAHELRTPVAVMLMQTQSALSRERSSAEYQQAVEACQRAAQRMRRLIESLLVLARLDAGQEQLKRMSFDLAETARDCAELIGPLAEERGLKLGLELERAPCLGDQERLAQVVTNLLTNAIQYNRSGGEVRLRTQHTNGTAVLTVSDNGTGISAEDLPHVFERFYQADKSRTGGAGNAGLGLAISKAIVEGHGGTIEAISTPGEGSTFTVKLPRAA